MLFPASSDNPKQERTKTRNFDALVESLFCSLDVTYSLKIRNLVIKKGYNFASAGVTGISIFYFSVNSCFPEIDKNTMKSILCEFWIFVDQSLLICLDIVPCLVYQPLWLLVSNRMKVIPRGSLFPWVSELIPKVFAGQNQFQLQLMFSWKWKRIHKMSEITTIINQKGDIWAGRKRSLKYK